MSRPRFLAESAAEVREAASWYEGQQPALGSRFLDYLGATLAGIEENPLSFPRHPGPARAFRLRRALLLRFPYEVVFQTQEDGVTVIAVAHTSREPGYWSSRLEET